MILKRKQIIMAALTIALGAAVFVNWYYTRPEAQPAAGSTVGESSGENSQTINNLGDAQYVSSTITGNSVKTQAKPESEYFAKARLSRQTAHDEACETLNDIIKDASYDEKVKTDATNELSKLAKLIKTQSDTENLITAKISADCLVIINSEKADVIVAKGSLNDTAALQIKDIIIKQTGFTSDKITIAEAK